MTRLDKLLIVCERHNLEVFHVSGEEAKDNRAKARALWSRHTPIGAAETFKDWAEQSGYIIRAGWYWWSCSPGCLPDAEPVGPFTSATRAAEDAAGDLL